MNKKMSITSLKKLKYQRPLVMITAYDALFAKLFEGVDVILVGDSLNMSFAGKNDTLSASLEQMIYHTNAVCSGAKDTFVICDMPFGTYSDKKSALKNAIKIYQNTQADAIKIEGGEEIAPTIKHLCDNGIAVCGHIGLLPQAFRGEGGYKIKGKDEQSKTQLIKDAKALEDAGAFCLVIEGVIAEVATSVAKSVQIPVVGIGSGVDVDGQVLVWSDMFGLNSGHKPKFVKEYLQGKELFKNALSTYIDDVISKKFPTKDETY